MNKTTTMAIIAIVAVLGLVAVTFAGVPQVEAAAWNGAPFQETPPGFSCGNNPAPVPHSCGGNPLQ